MQQINPIDPDTVIRDGAAVGRCPDEIHEGVAWWMASCLVVVTQASCVAAGHDGHPTSAAFHSRALGGATNAEHYACRVVDLGAVDRAELLVAMAHLGGVPGIHISTTDTDTVSIALYGSDGRPLTEDAGLARVRRMVVEDRVPRPVNSTAEGHIETYTPPGPKETR